MARSRRTVAAGVKLAVFAVAAIAVTLVVAATIRPFGSGGEKEYHALFASASRLASGDQVRVAGVVVGRVTGVEVTGDASADVTFTADEDLDLSTGTRATIRYLNLVGDRYLSLSQGGGEAIPEGATIPLTRTQPALDLDTLFNGFKPLFVALSPQDVNELALDIVQTLQGEGGTVTDLLQHTADLTSSLADRDVVIGRVVENLNGILATLDTKQVKLEELVTELSRFVGGVAKDRAAIGESLESIDAMAQVTAGLLRDARPGLQRDIDRLRATARTLNTPESRRLISDALVELPGKLARITRTASYGSWFNFYLCDARINIVQSGDGSVLDLLLGAVSQISIHDSSKRCDGT